ncbi:FAD-binding protein [Gracilibacillus salinarum]|uniref:FAD-binding protein n=1 Tax=Gracilibacillus salinarum TaxID=2932255 RepID=A0ABY4GGS3_9BACI|nr:FAD-binding protein [Gracilibacillus salinarum]UOQ83415.1 FAD-binding protein [Gracilibacillus salinarum]
MEKQQNWAGNYTYSTTNWHTPKDVADIQQLVKECNHIKVVGSRHSFNSIADSEHHMMSLEHLNQVIAFNKEAQTITVEAGMKYSDLSLYLEGTGLALHNLASLPHISVAGACMTATHGSGDRNGNLATIVSAIEFVDANGELVHLSRKDDEETLKALVVGLGGFGVITKLTLDLVPEYHIKQNVYHNLTLASFEEHVEEIFASAYSVSLFTDWSSPGFNQVWQKEKVAEGASAQAAPALFGATLATEKMHPIAGHGAEHCTDQLGVAGIWHDRMPHFRMNFTPSSGKELQTEYIIPRQHIVDAVTAVGQLGGKISPLLYVCELRSIAQDDLWMSMNYQQDSIGIHFTWKDDWERVQQVLPEIEKALEAFEPRPHWGKLFTMAPALVQAQYPKLPEFRSLLQKYDPNGKFRNAFLNQYIFGE